MRKVPSQMLLINIINQIFYSCLSLRSLDILNYFYVTGTLKQIKLGRVVLKLTKNEFWLISLMITGDRKQAAALAAVIKIEPPKYWYVDFTLSFTYSGHILYLRQKKTNCTIKYFFAIIWVRLRIEYTHNKLPIICSRLLGGTETRMNSSMDTPFTVSIDAEKWTHWHITATSYI